MSWAWFLIYATIDATNYRVEQALRPAVVNRKVWGGNRTWPGARIPEKLMTVMQTLDQRGHDPFDGLAQLRQSPIPLALTIPKR